MLRVELRCMNGNDVCDNERHGISSEIRGWRLWMGGGQMVELVKGTGH